MTITGSMFYKYTACPHWLYFDVWGDPKKKAKLSRFSEMLLERGVLHEQKIIEGLPLHSVTGHGNAERYAATIKLMQKGVDRIYHGVLMHGDMIGEPDILEKRTDQGSRFGHYFYVPIDIKNSDRLTDAHRFQLIFYANLLKDVQGVRPDEALVINSSGNRIGFIIAEFESAYNDALTAMRTMLSGVCPAAHLTSGCKQSPWFSECIALAEKEKDIALLYNLKQKAVNLLRSDGICTIDDVVHMDISRTHSRHSELSEKTLTRLYLQAKALTDRQHIFRQPINFGQTSCEIFFDIEGDPLRDVEYLFGFLIRQDGVEKYFSLLAPSPEEEKKLWQEFLLWIDTLPEDALVYHYGVYEPVRLAVLERRYGGSAGLSRFYHMLIDLNEIVKDAVVFPLYFYGLKDIGHYIGYERSKKISGGGESVAYYEEWLDTGDRAKLEAILLYNEDDVRATMALKDWLVRAWTQSNV